MEKEFSLYKEMLDNFYEGVYFVDVDRKITFWNKGAERISGFKSEDLIGKYCYDNVLNHLDDQNIELCRRGCPLHKTIGDGQQREAGVYLHHKDGHRVLVAVRTIPLYKDGEIIGAVEVFVDDNEKAKTNIQINTLKTAALYDQLTELPNRRYINSFINNRLSEFTSLGISFAVAMMDIDHFKRVNDTYGHDIGDLVLQMTAKTLKGAFRKNDLIGRWGGEEFLAILTAVSEADLIAVLEKARVLVEKSTLRSNGKPLQVTISLGGTIISDGDSASSIQKRADQALYMSKHKGRNKTSVI